MQVASAGDYPMWGYVHLDLNKQASSNPNQVMNANAQAYVNFVMGQEPDVLPQMGFIQLCKMNVQRSPDAGPYSPTTGATC
jgi:hypothetical protein